MATTSWTEDDIIRLKTAIARGATSYSHDGRTVVYRSLKEMRDLLAMMEDEVAGNTAPKPIAVSYPCLDKGLC